MLQNHARVFAGFVRELLGTRIHERETFGRSQQRDSDEEFRSVDGGGHREVRQMFQTLFVVRVPKAGNERRGGRWGLFQVWQTEWHNALCEDKRDDEVRRAAESDGEADDTSKPQPRWDMERGMTAPRFQKWGKFARKNNLRVLVHTTRRKRKRNEI